MHPLEQLYQNRCQDLFSYALCLTGHRQDAEDAIHTTFQKLLNSHAYENKRDLAPFVFRCLRNTIMDLHRRHRFTTLYETSLDHLELEIPEKALAGDAPLALPEIKLLWLAVEEREREVIVLKVLDGFTFREISLIQNTSIHTVSSCYRRGMEKIKRKYQFLLDRENVL